MGQGLRMDEGSRARGAAYVRRSVRAGMPVAMLLSLLCSAATVQAKPRSGELKGELKGVVTHVSDGDTLWVRLAAGERSVKVRFQGIDAPEICQTGGPQSLAALKAKVQGQTVTLQTNRYDDYGRMLARVSLSLSVGVGTGKGSNLARQDLGAWMVERGQAWSYRYRNNPGPYAPQEQAARTAKLGLWSTPGALEPRAFRKQHGSCAVPS
jgi:micrococcal nuclease